MLRYATALRVKKANILQFQNPLHAPCVHVDRTWEKRGLLDVTASAGHYVDEPDQKLKSHVSGKLSAI